VRRPGPGFWSDRRVELMLGAVACLVLLLIVGMIVFVFSKAWPSFAHNGFAWFTSGGDVDQQLEDIFASPSNPADYVYELRSSSSSSRPPGSSGCWSRWCGCSPRCPRSSTG
jgi:hypothetical protein